MADRPYTVLSCCISLDGYLDDSSEQRLILSSAADLDRVDAVRATSDAVLVGASTVRRDDPRLQVRSAARREQRVAAGLEPTPLRVTVTRRADLDPAARFFDGPRPVVYVPSRSVRRAHSRFGDRATVVDGGARVSVPRLGRDLHARGVRRLLVEGGGRVHT